MFSAHTFNNDELALVEIINDISKNFNIRRVEGSIELNRIAFSERIFNFLSVEFELKVDCKYVETS